MLQVNRRKEVYDKMLEAFEGMAFPMVVLGVSLNVVSKESAFVSLWLPALESEMTPVEREELSKQLGRASRALQAPFLRMVHQGTDPRG